LYIKGKRGKKEKEKKKKNETHWLSLLVVRLRAVTTPSSLSWAILSYQHGNTKAGNYEASSEESIDSTLLCFTYYLLGHSRTHTLGLHYLLCASNSLS
jgi:hypothetical protein